MRLSFLLPAFAILLARAPALAQATAPPRPAPADPDLQCAATFVMLENSARASGVSNGSFGATATMIQQVHMATHPGEDAAGYSLAISNTALAMQQAAASGALTFIMMQSQVAACRARYPAR